MVRSFWLIIQRFLVLQTARSGSGLIKLAPQPERGRFDQGQEVAGYFFSYRVAIRRNERLMRPKNRSTRLRCL